MKELKDKVVVVTGGATGIGLARGMMATSSSTCAPCWPTRPETTVVHEAAMPSFVVPGGSHGG